MSNARTQARKARKAVAEVETASALLDAAANWVNANGGKAVVIGGISIMRQPHDLKFKFSVVVGCVGKAPKPQGVSGE